VDATRDWTALGGDEGDLIELSKVAPDAEIGAKRGILFSTYALLRSKSKTGRSRLDQIIDWLDDDFDDVIALDEAHNAANALSMPGNGRPKGASLQALAVLEIQRRLPQARVVYLSATAATQIEGLAYAERLGIWGAKPAAFDTRENFLSTISSAGTGGLEIACRDLKAMGVYLSRALSMRGVEYELVEHKLTDWDRQTYDRTASGATSRPKWKRPCSTQASKMPSPARRSTATPLRASRASCKRLHDNQWNRARSGRVGNGAGAANHSL
jgi:hypothetical protein